MTSCSVCVTKRLQSVWRRPTLTTACRRSSAAAPDLPAAGPADPPNHGFPLSPVRRARSRREEALTWTIRSPTAYRKHQRTQTRRRHAEFKTGEKRRSSDLRVKLHLHVVWSGFVQNHRTLFKVLLENPKFPNIPNK